MITIVFKNLDRSELAKQIVHERLVPLLEKFPDLSRHKITVTLGMENAPAQAGADSFTVKIAVSGQKYGGLHLEKSASNLYAAMAEVIDAMLERLNRLGDKKRVRSRAKARGSKLRFALVDQER